MFRRVSVLRPYCGDAVLPNYLLVNTSTLESALVNLGEAARITELDPDGDRMGHRTGGRCDSEDWAILPEGATYTPFDPNDPDRNPVWQELAPLIHAN